MTNVYTRVVLYVLSSLLASIPAFSLGWFSYEYVNDVIVVTLSPEGLVNALMGGGLLSLAVFKKWGVGGSSSTPK